MPKCIICEKEEAVLDKVMIGGPIIDVCSDCTKYGKKVDITEIDRIIVHSPGEIERHFFLGLCKGD